MSTHLCIKVTWLGDRYHGLTEDKGAPEWPPSPLRLIQAFVSCAYQHGVYDLVLPALKWLERQKAPDILADYQPTVVHGFEHFVPDNDNRLDHKKPVVRIIKPVLLNERSHVTYVWTIQPNDTPPFEDIEHLCSTVSTFGCGIDQAFASAMLADIAAVDSEELGTRCQFRHVATTKSTAPVGTLRTPREGTLTNLDRVFSQNRKSAVVQTERRKKRWPTTFDRYVYTGIAERAPRPHAIFRLVDENGDTVTYPQSKLIHIAGMVKHLAIELMRDNPPRDLRMRSKDEWLRAYVSGHQSKEDKEGGVEHTQFSYVPLQTVNPHNDLADPGVRRVMIVAPFGDDAWLDHLAQRLDGMELRPLPNTILPPGTRLELIPDNKKDGVRDAYCKPACVWASTTPVILPGHDDHKPEKTRKLIEKALAQSGIDQPCEFEWSAFSRFRKMLPAHKYRKDPSDPSRKILINYVRPDHLLEQSAVHLTIRFTNSIAVPGPLTIGAGRHCGFGLMARTDD